MYGFLPPIKDQHKPSSYSKAKEKPGEDVMRFFNKKTYNLNIPQREDSD